MWRWKLFLSCNETFILRQKILTKVESSKLYAIRGVTEIEKRKIIF